MSTNMDFEIVENGGGYSAKCQNGYMGWYGGDRYNGRKQGCHLAASQAAVFADANLARMAANGFEHNSTLPWSNPHNAPSKVIDAVQHYRIIKTEMETQGPFETNIHYYEACHSTDKGAFEPSGDDFVRVSAGLHTMGVQWVEVKPQPVTA